MRYLVWVLIFVTTSASAQNKERINSVITAAQWVYVISDEGDVFSSRVSIEDREAIHDLEGALKSWGRYRLTTNRSDADLIFVIHSEGAGGIDPGRTINRGDAGGTEDILFVYLASQYPNGGAAWRAAMTHGLATPKIPLFELFKQQVEEAAKRKPPKP